MAYNILLISSDTNTTAALGDILAQQEKLRVLAPCSTENAAGVFSQSSVDIAVIDVNTPTGEELSLLDTIHTNWNYCYVIVFTSIQEFDVIYRVTGYSNTKYILKGKGFKALIDAISAILHKIDAAREADETVLKANRRLMEANDIIKNSVLLSFIQSGQLSDSVSELQLAIDMNLPFSLVYGSCRYDNDDLNNAENNHRNHKIAKMIGAYLNGNCKYEYVVDKHHSLLFFIQPTAPNENHFTNVIKENLEKAQENICALENFKLSFIFDADITWKALKERISHCAMLLSIYCGMDDSSFIADVNSQFSMDLTKKLEDDILSNIPTKMLKSDIGRFLSTGDIEGCEHTLYKF